MVTKFEKEVFRSVLSVRELMEKYGKTREEVMEAYDKVLAKSKSLDSYVPINEEWTPEEDKLLFKLKKADLTWKEIADQLKRTTGVVMSRHTLLSKRWTQEETEQIVALYDQGVTFYEIGETLCRDPDSCKARYQKVAFENYPEPWRRWREEERQSVKEMYADGMEIYQIAKEVGRSVRAVGNVISDMMAWHEIPSGAIKYDWPTLEKQIKPLLDEGLSSRKIAKKLKVPYTTLQNHIKKMEQTSGGYSVE